MTDDATHDFGDGRGPVAAHRHPNGGGWVADTAPVDATAYVGPNAQVSDNARVYGNAQVFGDARAYGNAHVSDNARVFGNARVTITSPRASRSDGYDFIAVQCADGAVRVIAGCRYFTFAEAREHWRRTRIGTDLGRETFAILRYLHLRCRQLGWIESRRAIAVTEAP